jgi:monoamine oxidase
MMNRRNALLTVGAAALGTARPVRAAARPDVLIVGAGLSGLYAAQMLEQAGMKVQVIEGSDRVGGRCMTRYDLPGQPEFGASQIGAMYARRANRATSGEHVVGDPYVADGDQPEPEAGDHGAVEGFATEPAAWR